MKSFVDYLKESKEEKKYTFKIKVAGDLPEHCEDVMETSMQKYQVSKFTKGKSSPIQANLVDFPTVKNASVTVFEVELDYPTTSSVLAELLANSTGISRDCIRVRTPLEDAVIDLENTYSADEKSKESLLTKDYPKENFQDKVGQKHVTSFLKDLAKARKENQPVQYKGANEALLAKKVPTAKSEEMPKVGPARSLFGSK